MNVIFIVTGFLYLFFSFSPAFFNNDSYCENVFTPPYKVDFDEVLTHSYSSQRVFNFANATQDVHEHLQSNVQTNSNSTGSLLHTNESIYENKRPTFTRPFESECKRCLPNFGNGDKNEYDYPDITYPIPFSVLYNDYTTHYVRYGEPDPRFPDFIHLGDVHPDAFLHSDYIVITGCSDNHLLPTFNLLYSIVYTNQHASIVFVDYGVTEEHIPLLVKELTKIHQIHQNLNSTAHLYYRKFNFANFPSWWSLSNRSVRGGYSWKVVSYFDVLNQTRRIINWTDGGAIWQGNINPDKSRALKNGLYTGMSNPNVGKWVHAASRTFLIGHGLSKQVSLKQTMCLGGYVWYDPSNAKVMNEVMYPFVQCAFTRKCISPLKTDRKNHRQDQAILTMLVHSAGVKESCNKNYVPTPAFHQDCEGALCTQKKHAQIMRIRTKYGIESLRGVV